MSNIGALLSELRKLKVRLKIEGEDLKVEAPPGALNEDLLRRLKDREGELLDLMGRATRRAGARPAANGSSHSRLSLPTPPPVEPARRSAESRLPLSFAQERLWFIDQMEERGAAYNVCGALELSGQLRPAVLAAVLSEICRRHESIRTRFLEHDGKPFQQVLSPRPLFLPAVDLSALPASQRRSETRKLARQDAVRRFDLSQGPLIRSLLVRSGDREHCLLVAMHHIASDGWSVAILIREFTLLYAAFSKGRPSPLSELPLQYADFSIWQRAWLRGEIRERLRMRWRRLLEGAPPLLELPSDRPRPHRADNRGGGRRFHIESRLAKKAEDLGHSHGATLFMSLLASFAAFLSRLTGMRDLVVGSPVANRTQGETEPLIGFFVNTLPLRIDLRGDPSLLTLLDRVRGIALQAYALQTLPLEQVVEALSVPRSLSHSPLFQTVFGLHNTASQTLELEGLKVRLLPSIYGAAKFDMSVNVDASGKPGEEGCDVEWEYSRGLFDAASIERMWHQWQTLLEAFCDDPGRKLSDAPIIGNAERRRLLERAHRPAALPQRPVVHELFRSQSRRSPQSTAVVWNRQRWTYRQLDWRAQALAQRMRRLGAGSGDCVALLLERGPEQVAAMIAVLSLGAAYVPLDSSSPPARLRFMLEDSKAVLAITQTSLTDSMPAGSVDFLLIEDVPDAGVDCEQGAAGGGVWPESLAYVIYTSGSTGQPKGVSVDHQSIVGLVRGADFVYLSEEDKVAQASNSSFDAATFEIWGALLNGGCIVGIEKETALSPEQLAEELERHRVTALFLTTALFNQVARRVPGAFGHLRHLLFGGELVDPDLVARVLKHDPPQRLLHVYGPTECTTFSTWKKVESAAPKGATVAIGGPVSHAELYVLDGQRDLAPDGVPGELCIGGLGLARGYHRRPALTAGRFVPNPLRETGSQAGARLYRTGDLVRWSGRGELEFLGRIDGQVKVRGFRIEPGEIETALTQHPRISQAAVQARPDPSGGRRLVAFVVVESGQNGERPWMEEVRQHLLKRLPEYMLPSAIERLERLPLTPSGKLDRLRLDELNPTPIASDDRAVAAPSTPTEARLVSIWRDVLQVEGIGVHDDFFALGGHSLLATQVASRIRDSFGVQMPVRRVFEDRTIARLAAGIDPLAAGVESSRPADIPPISQEGGSYLLSFAQERLWFLDQLEGGGAVYNVPAALRLSGRIDVAALQAGLSEIVRRHHVLRTAFAESGGVPRQIVKPHTGMAMPIIDLDSLPPALRACESARLGRQDAQRPFELARAPMIRAMLLVARWGQGLHRPGAEETELAPAAVGPAEALLLVNMHHIASDGWSIGVLVRELSQFYSAARGRRLSDLAKLPIQYADYAGWQRQWLTGTALERQRRFWSEHLKGAPELLELPTDRPRPPLQDLRGSILRVRIDSQLARGLAGLGRRSDATLYMTLLSGFMVLLSRWSGQRDIVVGTPIANRTKKQIEPLIGFFVNTLALRADLRGDPCFKDVIVTVGNASFEAFSHVDIPFEQVVDAVDPQRSLGHSPLFQAMFALQNAPMGRLDLSGVRLEAVEPSHATSKFDLSLSLAPSDSQARGAQSELIGEWEYSTALFDASTIERMSRHWINLLSAAVEDPSMRLSQLPLMDAAERRMVLQDWNSRASIEPPRQSVVGMFEEQVRRTPTATAVVFQGASLSYQELNERANRLARRLAVLDVQRETAVGLGMQRCLDSVVGLLAILKSGGAYLPLDPSHPAERLAGIVDDAGAGVVITRSEYSNEPWARAARTVLIDLQQPEIECRSDDNPGVEIDPDQIAYVIYTSGSTGLPKGVQVPHRSIAYHCLQDVALFQLGPEDRQMQFAACSFDASLEETLPPLLAGASVHLLPSDMWDAARIAQTIERDGLTLAHFPPATWQQWIRHQSGPEARDASSLRLVLVGGDVVPAQDVPQAMRAVPAPLLNAYGPTETTITSVVYQVPSGWKGHRLPIGRPLPGRSAYLVEPSGFPAPLGVRGELQLGGLGLARGYSDRPALTAQAFVPDPYSGRPGARLYRTGDMVRFLCDGSIDYLGRCDRQVKLRGFRIEPGEIEKVLGEHPGVGEATVILRRDAKGESMLAAYFVASTETPVDAEQLRSHLQSRLPAYMVPTALVELDELPLSSSGKIDRKALPAPDWSALWQADAVQPRNPVEEILAGIWSQVLGLGEVGIYDDFFERGGHSLLATQIVSRVRDAFGIQMPVRQVFASPTVAEFAKSLRDSDEGNRSEAPPPIAPLGRSVSTPGQDEGLPLSFAQERLWFLDQLEVGGAEYNMFAALRLDGPLSAPALSASIGEILRRHEALRTSFHQVDGVPRQQAAADFEAPLIQADLRRLPKQRRDAEVSRWAALEARRPFDLSRSPLLRIVLLRIEDQQHALLACMHHIASDGWSLSIFVRELSALYSAFSQGRRSPLAELPVQYSDFALWQRRWLEGETLERQRDFWIRQLKGAPSQLELPCDRPRPAERDGRGGLVPISIEPELAQELSGLSRGSGATLFMTLLAGYLTLLTRYCHQDDIVVGTPVANRVRPEVEPLIGFFVNTLALRVKLDQDPSFEELLRRVRQVALQSFSHQDIPFEQVVEAVDTVRDLSRTPVFQTMFVLQNAPEDTLDLADLRLSMLENEHAAARFDLTLSLQEDEGRLNGFWEYSSALFEAATIERMSRHLRTLLQQASAFPHRRLSQLKMLDSAERRHILEDWNPRVGRHPDPAPTSTPGSLHDLFQRQVRRDPSAKALTFEDRSLTYGQLDVLSSRLAMRLRSLGVGPEVRVGLCVERSMQLVVGVLAVLKAGGAYVPLDPLYPTERLAFLMEDCGAGLILTQAKWKAKLSGPGRPALCLDEIEDQSDEWEDGCAPRPFVTPANAAYVIYTSGTTGRPKGTVVTHANVVRLFESTRGWFDFGRGDVWTLFHSFAFDFSVWEIWGALLHGGRLVVVPYWISRSPDDFCELLAEEGVTALSQTPSAFRQLVRADAKRASAVAPLHRDLKWIFFGGEALDAEGLLPWIERHGTQRPRLINMYGITETTVHVTYQPIGSHQCRRLGSPIGTPIPDLSICILDPSSELSPIGVPGELCVAGEGLSRGYLERPGLTARRFVPNPYAGQSSAPGERIYRSGDLARWRPDGSVEYLGRIDNQVKIRGFRIELGEIQSLLSQHPQVAQSAVVCDAPEGSESRLIAYYLSEESAPSAEELRAFLKEKVPDYMLPAAFLALERFPLTENGKLDRGSLPQPDRHDLGSVAQGEPPFTATEEILAGIWSDVLGRESVFRDSDFFELGGHSLLATQLLSRVLDAFSAQVTVRDVFASPTLSEFAAVVDQGSKPSGDAVPPIRRLANRDDLPLSFAQQRLWLLDKMQGGSSVYNVPFALRMRGRLSYTALVSSFSEVVERHEVLRTAFVQGVQGAVQRIQPCGELAIPVVDLRELPRSRRDAEATRLATAESRRSFDLTRAPVVRAVLLLSQGNLMESGGVDSSTQDGTFVLLASMHHIVSDGWSMGILVRELTELYRAFVGNRPSPLPDLSVQYADFAVWQRNWLSGGELERQIEFWRRHLEGAPSLLELPTDRPRPPLQTHRGRALGFRLDGGLTSGLKRLSRSSGATLFMTVMTGLSVVYSRCSQQRDLVIGTPIANRNRREVEPLIGFFVNTLPLRIDLSDGPSFSRLLARVRKASLEAFAHQDVPFEHLVEALQPVRNLSHAPLLQTVFALQNAPFEMLHLGDLSCEQVETPTVTAKFDLTLFMGEDGDGLPSSFEYNSDLFEASTIEWMWRRLRTVLQAAVENPDVGVEEIELLSTAERRQVLEAWNSTESAFPQDRCLHDLFQAQALRSPEAPAVAFGLRGLTYRELDRRSDLLALRLQELGVEPETLVGVCMERSPELIVALLGIVKAGGVYLPLDPGNPPRRLSFMLEDSQARVLIVQSRVIELLRASIAGTESIELGERLSRSLASAIDGPSKAPLQASMGQGMSTLILDPDWGANERANRSPDRPELSPQNLGYAIYTSGSTGRPKGVQLTHRGWCNLADLTIRAWDLGPGDQMLQFGALSFDISVSEITAALCSGACLQLASADDLMPGPPLERVLRDRRITHAFLVPSAAAATDASNLPDLKLLAMGGEALPAELVARWGHGRLIFNAYGPTESTVLGTMTECSLDERKPAIGPPIPNFRGYIVDSWLRPMPVGVPGELLLAGVGLARGYLRRPGLTGERFIPDPFAQEPGGRLYRTGDLCRWLPDGRIDYLGRIDFQVKLRGFRIELGEIEASLMSHPQISEAVALVRESKPGDQRLIAFVVAENGCEAPPAGQMRTYLRERLPEHYVPAVFMALDRLPKSSSGKIDRAALPASEDARPQVETAYVKPRSEIEECLAAIWREVLNIDEIGVHDNFFDLGGHSLALVNIHSRLQNELGRELPVVRLFEHPTIASLAENLELGGYVSTADQSRKRAEARRRAIAKSRRKKAKPHELEEQKV